ncbi:MAG TPA: hypothetical protein VL443_06330 [Cyclobacteriaceae bacterium]|nr:hypothetical protein [Cyclobacteriaceae bacterium]
MSIFSVVVNEKTFQFIPANSNFEEVDQALDLFKQGFLDLKAKAVEAEAAKASEEVVQAEPVN